LSKPKRLKLYKNLKGCRHKLSFNKMKAVKKEIIVLVWKKSLPNSQQEYNNKLLSTQIPRKTSHLGLTTLVLFLVWPRNCRKNLSSNHASFRNSNRRRRIPDLDAFNQKLRAAVQLAL